MGHGCHHGLQLGRTTDPDMALGSSLGSDITLAPGNKEATYISLMFTTFAFLVLALSTEL